MSAGDSLVVLWRSGASVPRIRWVFERAIARTAEQPSDIVVLQLLLPSATPPGFGELGEIGRGLQVIAPRSRSLVLLPLGDGRWHSMVRTLLRTGLTVMRRKEPIRVASSLPHALDLWAATASPATPAVARLEDALDGLFTAVGAPPPVVRR